MNFKNPLVYFLLFFYSHVAFTQSAFRSDFVVPDSSIQTPESSTNQSAPQHLVLWSQVASGLEQSRPLQLEPTLSYAYLIHPKWYLGAHYDFQALVIETIKQASSGFFGIPHSHHFAIMPELRSFSWRYGLQFKFPLVGTHHLLASLQVASLNAWGYGLGARDLGPSAGGRSWLIPAKIGFEMTLLEKLSWITSLESRWTLSGQSPLQKVSIILSLQQEFH